MNTTIGWRQAASAVIVVATLLKRTTTFDLAKRRQLQSHSGDGLDRAGNAVTLNHNMPT